MSFRIISVFFVCITCLFFENSGPKKVKLKESGDLYIISIGIDKTNVFDSDSGFKYCRKDAKDIIDKITSDFEIEKTEILNYRKNNNTEKLKKLEKNRKKHIKNIISYSLLNEEATIENIKETFKKVIVSAAPNDYFIFSFSGVSLESALENTFLLPYNNSNIKPLRYGGFIEEPKKLKSLFSLVELANLMEQVASENQFVISEAGMGEAFGLNLVFNLFESNAEIIAGTKRNRIIISTNGPGLEGGDCNSRKVENGKLFDFIISSTKTHQIVTNFKKFESNLYNAQEECESYNNSDYIKIYNESDYRNIVLRFRRGNASRGSMAKKVKKQSIDKGNNTSEVYAFVVATDVYNENQNSWSDLKNPINDADAFSTILEDKYNTKVTKVYNKTKNEVLKAFLSFKQQIDENDKLIFFVAGHGYYSQDFSDGYLVLKDSYGLEDDVTLDSYLSMAKLNRILDGVESKQVFSIFDVCYGASFELNNADLPIENYSKIKIDNGLADFIAQKDKNTSRIVLASGQYEVPDYWIDSQEHSPFADKLIKAFESEQEFISPGKIYSYVQGNATTPILKKFGKHEPRGDFLLKVNVERTR